MSEPKSIAAQPSAGAQDKPRGWERRWSRLGEQKTKDHTPKGWNLFAVTEHKLLPDDFPLYATPAQPDTGDVAALWEARAHALDMTKKHGNPNGTDYEQGVNDQGHRWVSQIDRMIAALSTANTKGGA